MHHLLEDATVDPDVTSRQLLAVLGIAPPEGVALDVRPLTDLVAFSRDQPGSIVSSISSARENTRVAREVVSTELWECINAMWNAVPERQRAAIRLGPHEFFSFVEERAAMFAGLADSTMSRDDGWRFLVLGRSVERVDMIVRLLLSRVGDKPSSPGWVTVLRSAGAHDTYLRTYRGALDVGRVVQFLLLNRLFPRSVFHALRQAESCLEQLDLRPTVRVGAKAEAIRLLGKARSDLEFLRPEELLDDLTGRLESLRRTVRDVGEAVALQYFHSVPWVAWTNAGASERCTPPGTVMRRRQRSPTTRPGSRHAATAGRTLGSAASRPPRRPAPTATPTTGAPTSPRSTCTPRTPS